jgi:hypothetical protein
VTFYTEGNTNYSFALTSVGALAGSSGISGSSGTSAQPLTELSISGATNGSNRTFTISQEIDGSVSLFFVNGQLQQYGVDYTIVGNQLIINSQNPAPTPNYILKIFGGVILGVNGTSGSSGTRGTSGTSGSSGTSGTNYSFEIQEYLNENNTNLVFTAGTLSTNYGRTHVYQNGQKLYTNQYTIVSSAVTIIDTTHFDGSNYQIFAILI